MEIEPIPLIRFVYVLFPGAVVIGLMWRWSTDYKKALFAFARMLAQLMLIGYALVYIFGSQSGWLILAILIVMIAASSWIALNTVQAGRRELFYASLAAIGAGGGVTLICVTQGVLRADPWYAPSIVVPLGGMIFANAMTSVSLAAERICAELAGGATQEEAKATAFQAAMIPIINTFFAVGLVALPGMMTGQILSGVSPLIAARYQILVMCMIFSSAGLSTVLFLHLTSRSSALEKIAASIREKHH